MLDVAAPLALAAAGVAAIVWGAESFAEHLARTATRLGVSTLALALLLAGAEPEELASDLLAGLLRRHRHDDSLRMLEMLSRHGPLLDRHRA